jgi:PAS fold
MMEIILLSNSLNSRTADHLLLDPAVSCLSGERDFAELQDELHLLRAVIDNFPGGLLLIDKNLKVVFCNEQQKKLLNYPPDLFEYGNPSLEQIFRFNAIRGEYGEGDIEQHVRDRMELVRQRRAHVFERTRPNGTILEVRGVPLAGGGFMTTYLDITDRRSQVKFTPENSEYDKLTGASKRCSFACPYILYGCSLQSKQCCSTPLHGFRQF